MVRVKCDCASYMYGTVWMQDEPLAACPMPVHEWIADGLTTVEAVVWNVVRPLKACGVTVGIRAKNCYAMDSMAA